MPHRQPEALIRPLSELPLVIAAPPATSLHLQLAISRLFPAEAARRLAAAPSAAPMSEEWGRSDVPLVVCDALMPGQVLTINRDEGQVGDVSALWPYLGAIIARMSLTAAASSSLRWSA